jgi:hypothetical protein
LVSVALVMDEWGESFWSALQLIWERTLSYVPLPPIQTDIPAIEDVVPFRHFGAAVEPAQLYGNHAQDVTPGRRQVTVIVSEGRSRDRWSRPGRVLVVLLHALPLGLTERSVRLLEQLRRLVLGQAVGEAAEGALGAVLDLDREQRDEEQRELRDRLVQGVRRWVAAPRAEEGQHRQDEDLGSEAEDHHVALPVDLSHPCRPRMIAAGQTAFPPLCTSVPG